MDKRMLKHERSCEVFFPSSFISYKIVKLKLHSFPSNMMMMMIMMMYILYKKKGKKKMKNLHKKLLKLKILNFFYFLQKNFYPSQKSHKKCNFTFFHDLSDQKCKEMEKTISRKKTHHYRLNYI